MILVGTALGVTLLVNLPREAGMLLLGAFVLGYALYSLCRAAQTRVDPSALGLACRPLPAASPARCSAPAGRRTRSISRSAA